MVWIHALIEVESDVMNPMRPEKLLTIGRHIRLAPGQRILDVGAGRCGPAVFLAREFGCHVTAVEPHEPFLDEARARVSDAGVSDLFEFVAAAGADFTIEPERYDAAMCLGATWAWNGLDGTLQALAAGVRPEGHVLAGEPYKHDPDDVAHYEVHPWTLAEILERFEAAGLAVTWLARSSVDEWDEYVSVHARDLLEWLAANPGHPDAEEVKGWRREQARGLAEGYMGWAVVAGRKTANI
jgi:cyclopropane fatty-acyl-phospholipid synthase-like methyltransferase